MSFESVLTGDMVLGAMPAKRIEIMGQYTLLPTPVPIFLS